ncbi:Stp1/IreP family PP2C-type Ser/Thr phosphatase [uncultured Paludibaculum sp.]|uniref:Stp1/IreP family PP2C-type Ser/Thr phosphatase n=1 Tax=uncultured Paludibaculum sp. TaxID=1765020 RepID=UPI002AAB883A|nr:Stp1/IreP family PP2C-type Ser/Thr phosphatase [uncultured Paludibaculum sp.]
MMSWLSKWTAKPEPSGDMPPTDPPLASLLSDTGCHRQLNEDSARIVRAGERGLLLVVADGMGGHKAGEVASQTAVEMIEQEYRSARGTPGEALAKAFQRAHREILNLAAHDPSLKGMGTTCTALAIVHREAWAAHVGDSRLYLIRDGGIYQLSEDHTQCMELVRQGAMTLAEAHKHEDRNVLCRAMGTRPDLDAMTWPEPLPVQAGDCFLLCSDGLHDLVTNAEIRGVVAGSDTQEACQKLVQMARDRGGYDNITVAIARIPTAEQPEAMKPTRQLEVTE